MLESFLLVLSLCIDAGVASFAYGTNRIKIPFLSGLIITFISTLFLIISLCFGTLISGLLPSSITSALCYSFLLLLGVSRLFEGLLKNFLNKTATSPDHIEFKLFDFKLILNVYANSTAADLDHSKRLSSKESLYLGIALSLDSLIVGFGAALSTIHFGQVIIFSILFNAIAIVIGAFVGEKIRELLDLDFSWLSGAILIVLAIIKML